MPDPIRRAPGRAPRSGLRLGAALLALAGALCGAARAEKGVTDGIYRDRDAKTHTWVIQRSHLLLWNDRPYTPAGVVFPSAYLNDPSPETLARDSAELDRLKAAGIQDIWIDPQRGLMENDVRTTQSLVDAVESRGFRYGLRVGDRHREPLVGFTPGVTPLRIPVLDLQPGARFTREIRVPGARRVAYSLVELSSADGRTQNWAIATGQALVENDVARIDIQLKQTRLLGKNRGLLIVVPEVQVEPEELGSFGDQWAGMDAYGERLKKHLQGVKFGPGLRFILDPFAAGDGTVGQEETVFPTSESFRAAFREWLERRTGVQGINIQWRTNDRKIPGMEEACRLIPTWPPNDAPEGDGWLLDPVENVAYRCIPRQCRIWSDLEEFRAEALKRSMNRITTTLKQEGLNVPMLFSWGAYHPIFTNAPSPSGYDGLGAHLYGAAPGIGKEVAAYALAQAEEADRNTWLVATRLAGPQPTAGGKPEPLTRARLRETWEAIREAGFRGIYLDPRQVPDAVELAREAAPLLAADTPAMQQPLKVCFFPMPLATADRVARLSNGVWWLPSAAPARLLRYGDSIMGYEIDRPFGTDHQVQRGTVLWSTAGKQEVTFFLDRLSPVAMYDSAGADLKAKLKKNGLKVTLTEEPVVAAGVDAASLFPLELASAQLEEFEALLKQAETEKLDTSSLRSVYQEARRALAPGSAYSVYTAMAPYVSQLRDRMNPFLWIEAERPLSHNLTGIAFQAGCSGGTYLKLDRSQLPSSGFFRTRYRVDVRRAGSYELWVAGRVPGRPGVSPLIWQIDEEPAVEVKSANPVGEDFAPGIAWFSLGRITLQPGRHELAIVVAEKGAGEAERYLAGLDAIVLSRGAFSPKGSEKPTRVSSSR